MVISNQNDINFAEQFKHLKHLVLMPNSKEDINTDSLVDELMWKFPEARYGLRLHETLGIE
jgi:hypothetical protein